MTDDPQDQSNEGEGLWRRLWRRPKHWIFLGIPLGGFLAVLIGVGLTGGFLKTVEYTNSMAFCTGCHEMQAFVYQEFQESAHYNNASGVRAKCADCHVPKAFFPKMARKIEASFNEVPAHFMGKIDTREKFEAHRKELAERVWTRMRGNDSKACRTCHTYEAMKLDSQGRYARRKHSPEYLEATGRTCIDCHEGIAHKLPEDM